MTKKINYKISMGKWLQGCGLVFLLLLNACSSDDASNSNPVIVDGIYLQDVDSDEPDREVDFARLGQSLRFEGSGFKGVQKILVNGYETNFNSALATDNNLWLSISSKTETTEADSDKANTIVFIKGEERFEIPFEIRSSPPSITEISHTMPEAGDRITLYGSGLEFIESITFPGDIKVTEGIESDDEKGKFCHVIVPEHVSDEGGAILAEGANGGAYSPEYFNFQLGLLHNFDDIDTEEWSMGRIADDLTSVIPSSGDGPKSQGTYGSLNPDGESMAASDASVDVSRYWLNNGKWESMITSEIISPSTPTDKVAVQMDIYVEGEWNSGNIRFVVADGFGADKYAMFYAPWESDGERVPFENPESWFTITMPFSDSEDFEDGTFKDVLEVISTADFAQAGPWLENGPINEVPAQDTNVNIYFDNIRIVPLNTPEYSDFD